MSYLSLERTLVTLDELMQMDHVEIINGEIIEVAAAGVTQNIIIRNFARILDPFVISKRLGEVFTDRFTYLMFSEAGGLKDSFEPDVSFIRAENMLADLNPDKPYPGIPDLAVEIVSPNDKAENIQNKVRIYLEKGTDQVWVVYPSTREVYQYRRDNNPRVRIYRDSDEQIDTDALFSGLELTLAAVFAMPEWAKRT